jgi:hypothetical protein
MMEVDRRFIQKIEPGLTIHALVCSKIKYGMMYWKNIVVVAMETSDNQLDFSQILTQDFGTENFSYLLRQ